MERERTVERERHRWWPLPERTRDRDRERIRAEVFYTDRRKLDETKLEALKDTGMFRVVNSADLAEFRYKGDHAAMEKDLSVLERRRLIERAVVPAVNGPPVEVLSLTQDGVRLAREVSRGHGQQFWAGIPQPEELLHDSSLYRMTRMEADELRASGMKIRRIVMDHELKGKVYREMSGMKSAWDRGREPERRAEAAERNGLAMVDGTIMFPDVRIEYETPQGELGRVDLELTTPHYTARQIAAKRSAGMTIYGMKTPTWGRIENPRIAERLFRI